MNNGLLNPGKPDENIVPATIEDFVAKKKKPEDFGFKDMLPGQELRMKCFLIKFEEGSPQELNNIQSTRSRYKVVSRKIDVRPEGYSILIFYVEGGLLAPGVASVAAPEPEQPKKEEKDPEGEEPEELEPEQPGFEVIAELSGFDDGSGPDAPARETPSGPAESSAAKEKESIPTAFDDMSSDL